MRFQDYTLQESINDVGILKAMFMCGQSLSGKSFVISKINSGMVSARIVNTDKMLEFLQYKNMPASLDRVKTLTKDQLVLYLNSMLPLFVDGTSSNSNAVIRRQGLLESIGYDTGMIFVNCSLETSIKRLENRARKVPIEYITDKFNAIESLKPYYKTKFLYYEEINNDEGELTEEVIKRAFKQTLSFFTTPLNNPIGRETIQKMRDNNWKYLIDGACTKEYLSKLVSVWYHH